MTIRWFVEVSPVEASPLKERYCVEALQWQQALQQARKIRGDRSPMARFAMELLEVGYRATDPTSRLRYTVSKAPAGAPLSARPPAPTANGGKPANVPPGGNGANGGNGKSSHRMPSEPEIEELSNPVLVALPPPLETNYEDALPTMPQASEKPPAAEPISYETRPGESARAGSLRPSQIPLPGRKTRSRSIQTSPAVPRPNRSLPPVASVDSAAVRASGSAAPNLAAAPEEEPVPALPGLILLSQRREEPTEAVPILYREYAMAFETNLTPRELERYARAVWEQVRTHISHRPPGKFVQVALFDHRFSGRPERAPAAVLAWKDWRGDPVIRIRTTKAAVSEVPPEGETAKAAPAALNNDPLDAGWPLDSASSLPPGALHTAPPSSNGPEISVQSAPSEVAARVRLEASEAEGSGPIDLTALKRAESEAVLIEAEPIQPSAPLAAPAPVASSDDAPATQMSPAPLEAEPLEAEPLETSVPAPVAEAFRAAPVLEVVPDFGVENSDINAAAALAAAPLSAEESAPAPSELAAAGSFPAPAQPASIPVLPPPVPPPLEPREPAGATPEGLAPAPAPSPAPAPRASQPSQPRVARAPTPRSSANAVRRRGSSEDLIGELFEEMHQLHFMPDIVSGADYVLSCVLFMLPCEGVLIHVFDINAREFVVVRAAGPSFKDALLTKTPDTHPLFREAFRRAGSLNFPEAQSDERFSEERFQRLGVRVKSAMCGAVQHGGRYLGIIELLNPLGGEPFRVSEVNALDYICEQFADFVASKPIVLDEDAVLPKA